MKKKHLIIISLLIIILTGSIIGKINASKSIIQKSTIELMAIEQVEKYWSLLERYYQYRYVNGLREEEFQEVLSQAAIDSPYGIDGRVYRPMFGQVGSSVRSITDCKIIDSKTLSSNLYDVTSIVVTGQYVFNDPTIPEPTKQKTQYTKNYYFIEENGRIVIDREEIVSEKYK